MSRLIVKNLPKTITEEKIRKLFSQKGEITDIQLKYTANGKFRQFCFIGYSSEEQAKNAIDFFNNTCVNTNKITVEKCAQLGDSSKPKAWSKYASDSSSYKKTHKIKETPPKIKDEKVTEKRNELKELINKYKDEPMFEEFMHLHGTNDVNTLILKLEESDNNLKDINVNIENNLTKNEENSEEESNEETEKIANKNISDLEYMKMLMANSLGKKSEPRKRTEKKPKEVIKLYMLILRGLPYICKKSDIKHFFAPLTPYTIRIPRKTKGFAYVGFKTEKKMKQAMMTKDKSFMNGKRISVYEYIQKKEKDNEEICDEIRRNKWNNQVDVLNHEEDIAESGRIYFRNLSYSITEDDIQKLFEKFGPITEVDLPIDKKSRKLKGFGTVTFLMPEHAVQAYTELDGSIVQGRMLHLLPAKAKEDSNDLNKNINNYKQKKELKQKAQAGSSHNWNTLFLGHNAVADVIADQYNTSKEQVLDGRGKGSAAVRLALGETQIVAQTKQFLEENGVFLDAFNQGTKNRSKTILLAKNLPSQTTSNELQKIFSPYGILGRVILPPSGVTAIVEFLEPSEARKAFKNLAYTKFKNAPLYLEWAPENSLKKIESKTVVQRMEEEKEKPNEELEEEKEKPKVEKEVAKEELEEESEEEEPEEDTTLFVKNINFKTTEESLRKIFEKFGKLNYVTIAKKKNPTTSGNLLSMGYGFVRFQHKKDANKVLKDLQQFTLDGKLLELKRSERTLQSEEKTQKIPTKITKQNGSKILIRNIPFQANQIEIEEIFKAFGEIKAFRLPKKMTIGEEQHRGFAFVDYVTKSDAKRAFEALCQSTHLYGRRLVLEWAESQQDVEEIRKRTAQHFNFNNDGHSKIRKATLAADDFVN